MIKEKLEERTITTFVRIEEAMICDVCGREIKGPYFRIHTGHNDWGSESIESSEFKDICSGTCLNKEIEKYTERSNNDYNSEFINIEHENKPYLKKGVLI